MNAAPRFAAVLLAAGRSTRMGGENKLLRLRNGKPLIAWAAETAVQSRAECVVVVTGGRADEVKAACGAHAKLRFVSNPAPELGLSSSLRLGLEAAKDADAVAILLGDMPNISAQFLDALFSAWRKDAYAVAPSINGRFGNPVILGPAARTDCMSLTGDQGARRLLEAHAAEIVAIPAPVDTQRDFDTRDDFQT